MRVVSAYLDKVVSIYTDTKGRSRGRLFGSKSPVGDGRGAAVVVAVILGGQGQVGFDHLQCATTPEALQGVGVSAVSQEVDGESVAEAVGVSIGDASAFSEMTDEVAKCVKG